MCSSLVEASTIRHEDCEVLLPPDSSSSRCVRCTRHRSSLKIQAKRLQEVTQSRSEPSSHTNYHYLSRSELILRLSQEHHQRKVISKQHERLKEKVELLSQKVGVSVDRDLHNGLKEIMLQENENVLQSVPPNSIKVSVHVLVIINLMYYVMHVTGNLLEAAA